MSYDAARGRVLLFGGVGGAARLQDTWEWDGSLGTWTEVSPSSSPTARYGHAMAYDGARARTLLFGGSAAGSFLQDAWAWDGTSRSWTNVSSTVLPRQRFQAAMAWDAAAARVVLFGGFGGGSPGDLADTWEWNGGPLEAPGQLLQVPLGATGSTAEWTVQSISARARAGGTGYPAGSATHGAELLLWDQGAWRVMATNADAASGPNELQWSTSTPSVLQPLLQAQRLHFALKPTAPSGTGPGTVAVDYAEVTVRYRLP